MPRLAAPSSYERIHSSGVSAGVINDILQITDREKTQVTPTILTKLKNRGITASELCGSDSKKAQIDEIIEELKTETKHQALFNRAKNAGEDLVEVNHALRKLVLNIHGLERKREERAKKKARTQSSTPQYHNDQNAYSAPFPSGPAASIPPALKQEPPTTGPHSSETREEPAASFPLSKRIVLIHIDGEQAPYAFPLSKTITAKTEAAPGSSSPQLSVLKRSVEERLAPRILDWDHLTFRMDDDTPMKCDHQDAFDIICDEREQQKVINLEGLRVLVPTTLAPRGLGTSDVLPTKSYLVLTINRKRKCVNLPNSKFDSF